MLVWHHGSAVQPCKCPLCRRQITLLVPAEDSLPQRHDPEVAHILDKIQTYNRLFGDRETGLLQVFFLPSFLSLLFDRLQLHLALLCFAFIPLLLESDSDSDSDIIHHSCFAENARSSISVASPTAGVLRSSQIPSPCHSSSCLYCS